MTKTFVHKLTPAASKSGKDILTENFKITDIPRTMDVLGWKESARLMRKWFAGSAYELDPRIKTGSEPPSSTPANNLLQDLRFDWLSESSPRTKKIIDELITELTTTKEYNRLLGRKQNTIDQFSNGMKQLMVRLDRLGALDIKNNKINGNYFDFSNLSAIELEERSQINFINIGTSFIEQATDEFDDVYGALGGFSIKIAATSFGTKTNYQGQSVIYIDEIGLYARDTYEFINSKSDQLLGYWNHHTVVKPTPVEFFRSPDFIDQEGERFFKVTNNSFSGYRKKHGKGGDLLLYSNVKRIPTSIEIHLNSVDFLEYLHHKKIPQ